MNMSTDSQDLPSKQEETNEKGPISASLQAFMEKLGSFPTPEEKVAYGLQFMKETISQEGSPRFREFWEARKVVLPFFKENLNPAIRSRFWEEYVELTVEARRLKEILEEQSAFALEQIDLAIQSIENDLAKYQDLVAALQVPFAQKSSVISKREEFYTKVQAELGFLNTLASRLNALRKEVMKTDMRIRFKTKLFKRLSHLGDQVFPKRKELIDLLSNEFEKDVTLFVGEHFKENEIVGAPYYVLREEIKNLQGIAKLFTLSSNVFHRTRLALSECWDKVKEVEKVHKKEILEKRQAIAEQRSAIEKEAAVAAERARELEAEQREILRQKREKIAQIKDVATSLQGEASGLEIDAFAAKLEKLQSDITELKASKLEKQQLERLLRPLKDILAEKKDESLINLSDDDRKVLENLYLVLAQKKERRQEIKDTLETYRKQLGGSNLDFEKAIQLRELIDQEKERLEKASAGIQEIEEKIAKLES